jgi:hypothetical protein
MFLMKRMCTESTPMLIDNKYENHTEPQSSSLLSLSPDDQNNDNDNDNDNPGNIRKSTSSSSSGDSISQLSIGPEECVICLDPIELDSAYSFDCGHQLHVECFHRYFLYNYDYERNYISCPVCRQEVRLNMVNDGARNNSWIEHAIFGMKMFTIFTLTTTSMYLVLEYLD